VDPLATDSAATVQPSMAHPLGTDTFGRDILARIIHAARLDFFIAISVTLIALLLGACIGAAAGYVGRLLDDVVMRLVDLMLSFPAFILALAITVMLGNQVRYVIAAIAFAYIPHFVRLTRGEVLKIRDSEYADAARVVGNPPWRVAFRHVFPNAVAPALVFASIVFGWAILDASALGFLGIGIEPPAPEWGTMVAEGSDEISSGNWWTWLFPGLAILGVVVAFNWIGDGLRNLLRSA
jgi:peptide/nickel transport system permease protein